MQILSEITSIQPEALNRHGRRSAKSTVRKPKPTADNAVSVRPKTMCQMLDIGPTKAAELIREGKVESVLLGKTRLITVRSIIALAHGEAA